MEDSSLRDNFKIEGKWWLPDNADEQLCGTLMFLGGESIELVLIGRFTLSDGERHSHVILGESYTGTPVSLFDATCINEEPALIGRLTYAINYIFVGCHYANADELQFDALILESEVVTNWVADNRPRPKGDGDTVVWTRTSAKIIELPMSTQQFDLSLFSALEFQSHGAKQEVAELYKVRINAKTKQPFHILHEWLVMVCTFFEVLICEPVDYLRLHLVPSNSDPKWGSAEHVQLFLVHKTMSPSCSHRFELPLVPYRLVSDELQAMIVMWCEFYDQAFTAIDLLIGSYHQTSRHSRYQFLMLVQCLESLYNATRPGLIMDKKKFASIFGGPLAIHARSILKSALDLTPEIVHSVISQLKQSNRKTLRGRLDEFLVILGPTAGDFILRSQSSTEFFQRVVQTRNVLSHGLKRSTRTLSDIELQPTISTLQLMARFLVVELLMGGPKDKIATWMQNSAFGEEWKRQYGGPGGKPETGLAGRLLRRFGL